MKRPLPSSDSARDLVAGDWTAVPRVLGHMGGRAALMTPGMALAGIRGKHLVLGALGASLSIELFALAWFAIQDEVTT